MIAGYAFNNQMSFKFTESRQPSIYEGCEDNYMDPTSVIVNLQ